MVLLAEREQIEVERVKVKNRNHPIKDARDRNKPMKKENPKTLDVEKVLSTYDISKTNNEERKKIIHDYATALQNQMDQSIWS